MEKWLSAQDLSRYLNSKKELMKAIEDKSDSERFNLILKDIMKTSPRKLLNVSDAGSDLREDIPWVSRSKDSLEVNDLYWVKDVPVASNNSITYTTAIDFLVIEGVLSDLQALRYITAFRRALHSKTNRSVTAGSVGNMKRGDPNSQMMLVNALKHLKDNQLLDVSNAPLDFTSNLRVWTINDVSQENIHYIHFVPTKWTFTEWP